MDKLTTIKIKYEDETYSDEIPVSVLAENVEWDSTHTLVDILGSIDVDTKGSIQNQISQLFNEKVSNSDMQSYVSSSMSTYITNWLNTHAVGSAVDVDSSLTINGAAADAKVVGDEIIDLKEDLNTLNKYVFAEKTYELSVPLEYYPIATSAGDVVTVSNKTGENFTAQFGLVFYTADK